MTARLQLPAEARRGDVIEIRLLIQHAMETGYRTDETGRAIPRNTIRTLACRYDGVEVFSAELSSGISANPYLQFTTVAQESGVIECSWIDDAGQQGAVRQSIRVIG